MNDDRAQHNTTAADHDLLIKLDTKFDIMSDKFDALSSNLVSRVETFEREGVATKAVAIETSRNLEDAFNHWAGRWNLEERVDGIDEIDPIVLEELREMTS